jgi:hypothetical protein
MEQMGDPIPLEEQTYYKVGEYYSNIVNDADKENGKTGIEESGIQRDGQFCGDKNNIPLNSQQ